jgi:hypothetical protein
MIHMKTKLLTFLSVLLFSNLTIADPIKVLCKPYYHEQAAKGFQFGVSETDVIITIDRAHNQLTLDSSMWFKPYSQSLDELLSKDLANLSFHMSATDGIFKMENGVLYAVTLSSINFTQVGFIVANCRII